MRKKSLDINTIYVPEWTAFRSQNTASSFYLCWCWKHVNCQVVEDACYNNEVCVRLCPNVCFLLLCTWKSQVVHGGMEGTALKWRTRTAVVQNVCESWAQASWNTPFVSVDRSVENFSCYAPSSTLHLHMCSQFINQTLDLLCYLGGIPVFFRYLKLLRYLKDNISLVWKVTFIIGWNGPQQKSHTFFVAMTSQIVPWKLRHGMKIVSLLWNVREHQPRPAQNVHYHHANPRAQLLQPP